MMKPRTIYVFLAPALIAAPVALSAQPAAADTVARPIALSEAVRLAQQNSPLAVQARGELRTADVTARGAALAFLPNVNATASSSWQRGQRIGPQGNLIDFTGPSKSYNDGLSLNIELFDGGRRFFDIAAARAAVEAADAGQVTTAFQISLQVKEQYYNVLAAREAQSAANAQYAEAEQQLRAASARLQAGAAIRSDSLRSMVALGNAKLALIDAETDLAIANASLTRLVATTYLVTAADAPPDEALPNLEYSRLEPLLDHVPALREARSQLSSARASRRSARTGYLPTVNATYGRSGSGFDSQFGYGGQYAYSSSFRLNFSLPIFNQLERETGIVRANVALEQAEANLRDTELRMRQELRQALGLLSNAQQRVVVQQSSVDAAEEDLDIQRQRYALNASSLLDVLQSQAQLNQARSALISARFDSRVARARLEALLGRNLGEL